MWRYFTMSTAGLLLWNLGLHGAMQLVFNFNFSFNFNCNRTKELARPTEFARLSPKHLVVRSEG